MEENRVKLHRGVAVIEVDDPLLLTEIENDAMLQPILGDRLSDRCIVVQAQSINDAVRRLQASNGSQAANSPSQPDKASKKAAANRRPGTHRKRDVTGPTGCHRRTGTSLSQFCKTP